METINNEWRPAKKTSNALLNNGYSQEQLNRIGKIFIKRFYNKTVDSPSSEFTKMVRKSESAHNIKPKPDNGALADVKERTKDKSKDGSEKAKAIKVSEIDDTMKLACAEMIHKNYRTPMDECYRIVNLNQ